MYILLSMKINQTEAQSNMPPEKISISALAKAAGISTRTLRFYESAGLLIPKARNSSGQRLYDADQKLILQQILFYRDLDLSLSEIKQIINDPNFDIEEALNRHKQKLEQRIADTKQLLTTIDKTILFINKKTMLTDEELYKGLSKKEIAAIKEEVNQKYDPKIVAESNRRVKGYSKEQWAKIQEEAEDIYTQLAKLKLAGISPDAPEAQAQIDRHFQQMQNFYTVTKEMYRNLGEMYISDPRFTEFYEKRATGLAEWVHSAINEYCK